jgi:hypothetical protein
MTATERGVQELDYATPQGRSRVQSRWGWVAMISAFLAVPAIFLAEVLQWRVVNPLRLTGDEMAYNRYMVWLMLPIGALILGLVLAAFVCGIIGLVQGSRSRKMALLGLMLGLADIGGMIILG